MAAHPGTAASACASVRADPPGLLNYAAIHSCLLRGDRRLSLPVLALLLLLHFRVLAAAAGTHFSPAVSRLAARLRLSPSMAAVTLLALGNGAPDAFASAAALRGEGSLQRAGLAAILSAGAFVSAFVVGAVALIAAPFAVPPASFARDAFFYLLAASGLFYIYLSGEIFLWQACGLVLFYVFFVGLVFYMDLGAEGKAVSTAELEMANGVDRMVMDLPVTMEHQKQHSPSLWTALTKVTKVWEWPVTFVLKLTVPSTLPSEWNKFYICVNICLCPLILLYSFSSFIPLDSRIVFLLPQIRFPLWSVVLLVSFCLALSHFLLEKEAPETENIASTLISFVMSVFWISTMAGELLNCLAAIGVIMDFSPAILGMTVLAWGNSVGDLVADVALAKAGQPTIAIAGCFAGPMFNMLVGLGTALVTQTARVYPKAYVLEFHVGIVVAFVFLLLSLMGTLLVVTWTRFRVPRFWGYCLPGVKMIVHKNILAENSTFFADKLSRQSPVSCIEVPDCEDVEIFVETVGLMYCKDVKQRLIKQNVPRILQILKVAESLGFRACVISCLDYLEAIPWVGDEEENVVSSIRQLHCENYGVSSLLKRVTSELTNPPNNTLAHIIELVLKSSEDRGRREMKYLVLKLFKENNIWINGSADSCIVTLYSSCRNCLQSLLTLFRQASDPEFAEQSSDNKEPTFRQITLQADNVLWLAEILADRNAADELAVIWASQGDLAGLHCRVPVMYRHLVSCVTARLFVAIGKGEVLPSKETRQLLLDVWLQPLMEDYNWLQHGCRSFDRKVVEEGIGQTILTLPLEDQQTILLTWMGRFLKVGDSCPNLQRAFEVWWRRTFIRPYTEQQASSSQSGRS